MAKSRKHPLTANEAVIVAASLTTPPATLKIIQQLAEAILCAAIPSPDTALSDQSIRLGIDTLPGHSVSGRGNRSIHSWDPETLSTLAYEIIAKLSA